MKRYYSANPNIIMWHTHSCGPWPWPCITCQLPWQVRRKVICTQVAIIFYADLYYSLANHCHLYVCTCVYIHMPVAPTFNYKAESITNIDFMHTILIMCLKNLVTIIAQITILLYDIVLECELVSLEHHMLRLNDHSKFQHYRISEG